MGRIALLVSAKIDPQATESIQNGDCPRRDYLELARALDATIINQETAVSKAWEGRSKTALGPAIAQALHAFQRREEYDCILTDSEHVGIPLAVLFKMAGVRKGHVMIGHRLSPPKKAVFFRGLRLHSHIDQVICYGSAQVEYALSLLRIPADKVAFVLHPADHLFWRPLAMPEEQMICSAGLEFRDYPTLIEAVWDTDVNLTIAAASPWSRRTSGASQRELPSNIAVSSHTYAELRRLYARSLFVVVPIIDNDFQAGSLVMYEAMAMGKAVIATKTRGQVDILQENLTGLYVPPGDVIALRRAICRLLENPREAEEMGRNARTVVEMGLNLDTYVSNVGQIVCRVHGSAVGKE
ncbi:MAG: glycosyltransferase family 4 protein [Chloroflexi bacterium]|nr:glycosyltransferase family 4 protein [Chloroflexota bacterium]